MGGSLVEFLWAVVAIVIGLPVGITLALQWGKTREQALKVRQAEVNVEQTKLNEQAEQGHQDRLNAAITRSEREIELAQSQTPEARELKASEQALKTAENRAAAAEAEVRAKAAAQSLPEWVAAEREIVAARLAAALNSITDWVASHPEITLPNPFANMKIESMYKEYVDKCYLQDVEPKTFNEWIGDSMERIMIGFVKAINK
jgi:hypothetical protein